MTAQPADWRRIIVCGLVAGFVWTLLSITLLVSVGDDFMAAMPGHKPKPTESGRQIFLFGSNLLASIWAMWLYTAIRPRYGPGAKTAAVAGCAWWFIQSLQSAKWVALTGVPLNVTIAPLAATLPAIIVAMLTGVWLYEKSASRNPPAK
jgi:hypothetical protein